MDGWMDGVSLEVFVHALTYFLDLTVGSVRCRCRYGALGRYPMRTMTMTMSGIFRDFPMEGRTPRPSTSGFKARSRTPRTGKVIGANLNSRP